MNWDILDAKTAFDRHAHDWDSLQRATTNTPFLETTFIGPLLAVFGQGDERLALLHEQGTLRAATLVRPRGRAGWESFQPSQLPLGPWVAAPGVDLAASLQGLMAALPGPVLSVGLTQLDPRLNPRPDADAGTVRTMDYIRTSYLDVTDDFDAYWASRGKNLRQNSRKQRNKLQADGTETRLECLQSPGDVDEALADYGALESAGWKAGTGTAIEADNDQGRFYRAMMKAFCAEGRGRIYRYRFGDKVVAMDLCIDNGPLVVVLKTAYDESYRQVSPSTLMRQEQFQAWWEEGRYRRIEFYGKTLEWHTRWTSDERTLYHATAYRWPWLARWAARRSAAAAATEPAPVAG